MTTYFPFRFDSQKVYPAGTDGIFDPVIFRRDVEPQPRLNALKIAAVKPTSLLMQAATRRLSPLMIFSDIPRRELVDKCLV